LTRYLFLPVRAIFFLVILLSSFYSLLAYIPFTYEQVHKGGAIEAWQAFARFQPFAHWLTLILLTYTLRGELSNRRTKMLTGVFLLFELLIGVLSLFHPVLRHLQNNNSSFVLSLIFLAPVFGLFAIDWFGYGKTLSWSKSEELNSTYFFWAAGSSAVYVSVLYCWLSYLLRPASHTEDFLHNGWSVAMGWSIASHIVLFLGIFVLFNFVSGVAGLFQSGARIEFIASNVLVACSTYLLFQRIAFPSIGFYGGTAWTYGVFLSLTLVGMLAGTSLRVQAESGGAIEDGIALSLRLFGIGKRGSLLPNLLLLMGVTLLFVVLVQRVAAYDWNFLAQKLLASFMWVFALGCFYSISKISRPARSKLILAFVVVVLVTYKTLEASTWRWWGLLEGDSRDPQVTLESYSKLDVSFQLVQRILSPAKGSDSFFQFLTRNTNISRSVRLNPVNINLVENLQETPGNRPNIFIFVIDSLRRDYLSPYNPAVQFTPSIRNFAADSVVFENAFTHYGGTGLSEPSIWLGGMLIHQQYVTPFAPMNSLQKLLQAEKYNCLVSRDSILETILSHWPALTELDKGTPTLRLDLCKTLNELKKNISEQKTQGKAFFAYTQPQNIHISVINREGKSVVDNGSYEGFYVPYASRLKKIDACFGEFVEFLKKAGLYEQSIIILTSDHGESLGEDGRWGHAYTIFPEVLRIPLIIHLPTNLRSLHSVDTKAVSFLTDLTPTLYEMLGHRPVHTPELFGRPLFTTTPSRLYRPKPTDYLVASSYGAVYGVLNAEGNRLYIADAVNYRNYLYDLSRQPLGVAMTVPDSVRERNEQIIREQISAIGNFYGYASGL
jgi:hypothetical protein